MQPSQNGGEIRVLETPRAMLVRMPLGLERSAAYRVMARDDTLLIAGEDRVESIRLPRPAAPRGLTASQDADVLYVRVPLESAVQPSWRADQRERARRQTVTASASSRFPTQAAWR